MYIDKEDVWVIDGGWLILFPFIDILHIHKKYASIFDSKEKYKQMSKRVLIWYSYVSFTRNDQKVFGPIYI
jgi:hypothetical protein